MDQPHQAPFSSVLNSCSHVQTHTHSLALTHRHTHTTGVDISSLPLTPALVHLQLSGLGGCFLNTLENSEPQH